MGYYGNYTASELEGETLYRGVLFDGRYRVHFFQDILGKDLDRAVKRLIRDWESRIYNSWSKVVVSTNDRTVLTIERGQRFNHISELF